jgi:hypothetical protein
VLGFEPVALAVVPVAFAVVTESNHPGVAVSFALAMESNHLELAVLFAVMCLAMMSPHQQGTDYSYQQPLVAFAQTYWYCRQKLAVQFHPCPCRQKLALQQAVQFHPCLYRQTSCLDQPSGCPEQGFQPLSCPEQGFQPLGCKYA